MKKEDDSYLPKNGIRGKGRSFYNTIGLRGGDLKKAEMICGSQETKILAFLNSNANAGFTKHEIKKCLVKLRQLGSKTPESSISRALSNLYKDDRIIKHSETRKGEFDKPNHLWSIRKEKEVESVGIQTVLFE